jgi:predicted dehydrogenase
MGAIGVGSMGTGNMRNFLGIPEVQMVAVCDVDSNHSKRAKEIVDKHYGNNDCATYRDYRDFLTRDDLDAICLALPDHWHAIPVIAAARKGLDMYGEKPLARSITEGRAMCDAVHRYSCVWQTGSWQRSGGRFRRAAELVRNGRIGTVTCVEVGLPGGPGSRDYPPIEQPPANLDWDFWLGPAPERKFMNFGPHWNWRWIMDYSGGQLTDWAGHHIDIAHWGLGFDYTGPVKIIPKGAKYPETGIYDVPYDYRFVCRYANGVEIEVSNQFPMGAKWYGDKGWIHVNRGMIDASPKHVLKDVIGPDEIKLYKSDHHQRNFIECVKSREKTVTPIEVAHRSISVGLLGEIALLTGRAISWNPEKEKIIGDPEASALLGRAYREPWVL